MIHVLFLVTAFLALSGHVQATGGMNNQRPLPPINQAQTSGEDPESVDSGIQLAPLNDLEAGSDEGDERPEKHTPFWKSPSFDNAAQGLGTTILGLLLALWGPTGIEALRAGVLATDAAFLPTFLSLAASSVGSSFFVYGWSRLSRCIYDPAMTALSIGSAEEAEGYRTRLINAAYKASHLWHAAGGCIAGGLSLAGQMMAPTFDFSHLDPGLSPYNQTNS